MSMKASNFLATGWTSTQHLTSVHFEDTVQRTVCEDRSGFMYREDLGHSVITNMFFKRNMTSDLKLFQLKGLASVEL